MLANTKKTAAATNTGDLGRARWRMLRLKLPEPLKTFQLLLLFALSCAAAQAQFDYRTDNGEITITGYTGLGGTVVVPETINDFPVTNIGPGAFSGCTSLTSVIIPNSVTSIEFQAFNGCSSLTSVTIPDGVTSLGTSAFERCTSLTEVIIPDSVTFFDGFAFAGCTSLTSVTIGNSVTWIGDHAFRDCTSLIGVYFGGNAPEVHTQFVDEKRFRYQTTAIVYYRADATGWTETFGGRPTALWIDPPVYDDWIGSTALPSNSQETDDADQDNMTNYAEMLAGTNPTDGTSLLTFDPKPRPSDLTEEDQTPIGTNQHALYVQSIPGKSYAVQWADSPTGPWNVDAVFTATTTQMRFVFDKPQGQGFYRVTLAQ